MKVFVIVATHNPMKWIDRCLGSLRQSNCAVEALVIDNMSTDGCREYIKTNYPEVGLIEAENNLGFGAANNIGLRKALEAEADYVLLLNQDAWIRPSTIDQLIAAQRLEPEYGIVSPLHLNGSGDALDHNFSSYIVPSKCKGLLSDGFLNTVKNQIYEIAFVNAAAWLISRECMQTVGGFNPSFFHYGEDDNYIQRATYHGLKTGILPTATICHDRDDNQNSIFFTDEGTLFKRKIILKASRPDDNFSFLDERKKWYKAMIKSMVFFRFREMQERLTKINILNGLNQKEIADNRNESRIKKPSFLD